MALKCVHLFPLSVITVFTCVLFLYRSSTIAGAVSTLVTAPMDMVKTRLMLQRESKEVGMYRNGFHCAYQVGTLLLYDFSMSLYLLCAFLFFIPFEQLVLQVFLSVTISTILSTFFFFTKLCQSNPAQSKRFIWFIMVE